MFRPPHTNGISFEDLYKRLEAETPTRADVVVNTNEHVALDLLPAEGDTPPEVGLFFMTPEIPQLDGQLAHMTTHMHGQVAARTGIDKRYYDRMRTAQPALLMRNIETWWNAEPDTRMARTVQAASVVDGKVQVGQLTGRAWLSDMYRTLDNYDFVMTVLQEADQHGARILSCNLDDERVYLKLVSEQLAVQVGRHGLMEAGVIVKNSEVGDGKVLVQPYYLQQWCSNGAVGEEKFGQVHLGGAHELGILQHDTLQAEAASIWLQVRDWVRAVFTGHFLEKQRDLLLQAEGVRIPVPAKLAVANVVRNYGLTSRDGEGILERYLRSNGDTLFDLANAVTQFAHSGDNSFRRQVELEVHGGSMLATPAERFLHMVQTPLGEEQIAKAINV